MAQVYRRVTIPHGHRQRFASRSDFLKTSLGSKCLWRQLSPAQRLRHTVQREGGCAFFERSASHEQSPSAPSEGRGLGGVGMAPLPGRQEREGMLSPTREDVRAVGDGLPHERPGCVLRPLPSPFLSPRSSSFPSHRPPPGEVGGGKRCPQGGGGRWVPQDLPYTHRVGPVAWSLPRQKPPHLAPPSNPLHCLYRPSASIAWGSLQYQPEAPFRPC